MSAILISVGIFFYIGISGYILSNFLSIQLNSIQKILISPTVGISVYLVIIFYLNSFGYPVGIFSKHLFITSIVIIILIIIFNKIYIDIKKISYYSFILMVGLILVAWPMFLYDLNWVSFANDDMANYSLASARFLNNGYYSNPDFNELYQGDNYSLAYWFMHAKGNVRAGGDLFLAYISGITGLNPHQLFMPLMVALNSTLLCAIGALAATGRNSFKSSMIALFIGIICPLIALGTLYQLLGQVGGLSLLCAAILLISTFKNTRLKVDTAKNLTLIGLISSGLIIWYPEALPFLVLAYFVDFLVKYKISTKYYKIALINSIILVIPVLLILNSYLISAIKFMFGQAGGGTANVNIDLILFPYYLIPSGLSVFWGLIPLAARIEEPFLSMSIVIAIAIFILLIVKVIPFGIKTRSNSVAILIVMLSMTIFLFIRKNDFGLFKITMFMQPFLIVLISTWIAQQNFNKWKISISIALISSLIYSQQIYVYRSTGNSFGGMSELSMYSENRMNEKFSKFFNDITKNSLYDKAYLFLTTNVVQAKFISLYTIGYPTIFTSRNFYENIIAGNNDISNQNLVNQYDSSTNVYGNLFYTPKKEILNNKKIIYINSNLKDSIFNNFEKNNFYNDRFNYFSTDKLNNYLVFIHSSMGNHYYLGGRDKISFWRLEKDPMVSGGHFSALGKVLLMEVINPDPAGIRIIFDQTATVLQQHNGLLATPTIQGSKLNFSGRGSGRMVTPLLYPEKINGNYYLQIDMSREGIKFNRSISWLMNLYGKNIPGDYRRISTFGRNISAISEADYRAILAPSSLSEFPNDLMSSNFEYSGIYEDGWISENSFFDLAAKNKRNLIISGFVPLISNKNFQTTLQVNVNGVLVSDSKLSIGDFKVKISTIPSAQIQRVELKFSSSQKLPGADGRITAAKISYIGFSNE